MSPGNRAGRMAENRIEQVEHCDLIVERFVNRPAGCGVRGAGESESIREQKSTRGWIADIRRGNRASRDHIAMAIEKQRSIPIGRNFHQVSCAVAERSRFSRKTCLRTRARRNRKNENRDEYDKKPSIFELLPHINPSFHFESREAVPRTTQLADEILCIARGSRISNRRASPKLEIHPRAQLDLAFRQRGSETERRAGRKR